MKSMRRSIILTALGLMTIVGQAVADPVYWTSWSANTVGSITAPQGTITVSFSGELSGFSQNYPSWSPLSTFADGAIVDSGPPQAGGMVNLVGGASTINTISFSEPVVNPVFSIWSLGQLGIIASFDFDATPTLISGGPSAEYAGATISLSGNSVFGEEGSGTIMFPGTFSSLTWNNPVYEFYYGFTVGVTAVPEPATVLLLSFGAMSFAINRRPRRSNNIS